MRGSCCIRQILGHRRGPASMGLHPMRPGRRRPRGRRHTVPLGYRTRRESEIAHRAHHRRLEGGWPPNPRESALPRNHTTRVRRIPPLKRPGFTTRLTRVFTDPPLSAARRPINREKGKSEHSKSVIHDRFTVIIPDSSNLLSRPPNVNTTSRIQLNNAMKAFQQILIPSRPHRVNIKNNIII